MAVIQLSNTPGITGLVLAGGAGRRVGGHDKGTLAWRGAPLAEHVCRRLRPQVDELWISCNRNTDFYARLADRVFKDDLPGFEGPLAGIATAAPKLATPLLLVCACDTPLIPVDLVARISEPMLNPALQLCVAFDGEREQYLAAIVRRDALSTLSDYLARGERSVRGWYATLRRERVDFSDQPGCFDNINRIDPET